MKFSTSIALAAAPLAMARRVQNVYPAAVARGDHHDMKGYGGGDGGDGGYGGSSGGYGGSYGGDSGYGGGYGVTASSSTEVIIIWANPGNNAETTTYHDKKTVTKTVTVDGETKTSDCSGSATHTVKVGGPAGLVYQPDQLNNVPVGDTVVFEFLSKNHTITQSGFDTPCKKIDGGMDSGFQPNPDNNVSPPPQVAMQVMVDTPLWFYCRQAGHCGKGMVFSINPTAEKTQAKFQQQAIAQNGKGASTPITGGSPPAGDANAPAQQSSSSSSDSSSATSSASGSVATGDGKIEGGHCVCQVACQAGSFPVNAQGIGAQGGYAGSLPTNMAAM